nr:retrovirus-related Pol polyprotein from transposon TNT 1-94 [Tanacetum cinerariifolium]
MTGNISYLTDFKEHDGGYVAFGRGAKGGKITNKGTIRTVVKPHFKTPYELFKGRSPALSFMRPFGCNVTILNTIDQLDKFDGKSNERIFVGYSKISKAVKVYNTRTRKVEENLHITFLNNKLMIAGGGPEWLFDIDTLLESMNYAPVSAERPNPESSTKTVNTVGPVNTATPTYASYLSDPLMPDLENTGNCDDAYDDRDEGVEADYNNLETFKLLNVWTLVDLLHRKRAIGTKCVFRNKRDQRGIVVRNKARLVAHGHRQEKGIDYDEVFALVARIEAIRLFLAYASFMNFTVYQMDVKSAFLYGTIEEVVYVSHPPGFVDPEFLDRVYKVEKALYGFHQALRAWYETLSTYLLENGFRKGTIDKTLFIKKINNDILLIQVYVDDIIFGSTQRLDIMFAVCACSRFQVQPKVSHMHAVKIIFRYLKGQPTLGLWYPKDLPLELIAYSDSDYTGASLDRKSTTRGCQFLGLEPKGYLINDSYADLVQHADKKELAIPGQTPTGKEFSNMLIAEKSDDNREFHQIVDFLSSCSINYALTMSVSGAKKPYEVLFLRLNIVPPTPYDSPLTGGYTPGSDEGRLKLEELMDLCKILSNKVTTFGNELSSTKAVYHKAFITLTKRVKKLETQLKQTKSREVIVKPT